jgi:hypothetical protein
MRDAIQRVEPDSAATVARGAKNPSEQKNRRSANENESHQRREAAASLPPRPGVPCSTHRAESIPLALPPLTHGRYPFPFCHYFPFHFEGARTAAMSRFNI